MWNKLAMAPVAVCEELFYRYLMVTFEFILLYLSRESIDVWHLDEKKVNKNIDMNKN